MFISIGCAAQHVSDAAGLVMLAGNPQARESTALEAAQCVDRYVINGDARMHEANDDFNRIYGAKQREFVEELKRKAAESRGEAA